MMALSSKQWLFFSILVVAFPPFTHGASLRRLTDAFMQLDCPHWDPVLGVLYMVDRPRGFVIKFDPRTEYTTQVYLGSGEVGPIFTVEGSNSTFIAGRGHDLIKFDWDGSGGPAANISVLATVESQQLTSGFYSGQVDSHGRIWIGTYSTDGTNNTSGLYMIDPAKNFSVTKKLDNVSKSNGITWNQEDDEFYYVDTPTHNVDLFDFDAETGELSNRRTVYNTLNSTFFGVKSLPGGIAMDNDTHIWLATETAFGAGYVAALNLTSEMWFRAAAVDPKLLTSLSWGGENLDVLYVTTSRLGLTESEIDFWRGSGALFSFTEMGPFGYAPNKVRLPTTTGGNEQGF